MKKLFKNTAIFFLLGSVALSLTLKPAPRPPVEERFPHLIKPSELFAEDSHIVIAVKPLTEEESQKYLHTSPLDYGYRPFQVTIENQSQDPYLISKESISLPIVDPYKLASKSSGSLGASIGLKVAGFLFWPFSIPSTMYGVKTLEKEQRLGKELWVKSVKEEIIPPYSSINRVFFLDTQEQDLCFSLTLSNQETLESKVFEVGVEPKNPQKVIEPLCMPLENYYLTHDQ